MNTKALFIDFQSFSFLFETRFCLLWIENSETNPVNFNQGVLWKSVVERFCVILKWFFVEKSSHRTLINPRVKNVFCSFFVKEGWFRRRVCLIVCMLYCLTMFMSEYALLNQFEKNVTLFVCLSELFFCMIVSFVIWLLVCQKLIKMFLISLKTR